jgi:hypothetical protein
VLHKVRQSVEQVAVVAALGTMSAHTVVVMGHNVPSQGGVFSSDPEDPCRYSSTVMRVTQAGYHRIQPRLQMLGVL